MKKIVIFPFSVSVSFTAWGNSYGADFIVNYSSLGLTSRPFGCIVSGQMSTGAGVAIALAGYDRVVCNGSIFRPTSTNAGTFSGNLILIV